MTPQEALEKAAEILGSMQTLAEKLGVTKGAVSQWKLEGRRIPAEHCPLIEKLTGGEVRCEQLRPDVEWAAIRNCGGASGTARNQRATDPDPHEPRKPPSVKGLD
jgi:DNA-binding transcriptional regulator YdaS (Cro superfamily)